jgi:hypothetical protein
MEEEKVFTLKQHLEAIALAYVTGKTKVAVKEKENMIEHMKVSSTNWAKILINKTED